MINKDYDYTYELEKVEKQKVENLEPAQKEIVELIYQYDFKDIEQDKKEEALLNYLKLEDNNSNSKYKNIKNYLKYSVLTKLGIVKNFDCDNLEEVKEILKKYIEKKCHNVKVTCKDKDRHFKINNWVFETDTANSFQTLFGQYLRAKYYEIYMEYKNIYKKESVILRDFCFIKNVDKIDDDILVHFNSLASNYHKIGNFTLVPYGYNQFRNFKYKDYYDLSINALRDNLWNFDNEYENIFKTLTGEAFIGEKKFKPEKINEKNIINSINNMLQFINERGEDIKIVLESGEKNEKIKYY